MRFFDHNATTPLWAEAKAAWVEANEMHWLNPSSPYRSAAAVHAQLEQGRERLAVLFDVDPRRIVFNSGATEGNNAVFATWAKMLKATDRVVVGVTEHPSVLAAAERYFEGRIDWLPADPAGVVGPATAEWSDASAISVMAANNETGVLNPWQDWLAACRECGIPMHCDASQWIGKMPLDGLGNCDYVTGCAHKFGGPKGVGFLIMPEGSAVGLAGGAQERGRRAGTEDVAGILALVAAVEVADSKRLGCSDKHKMAFLAALEQSLPGVQVIGDRQHTLWNTVEIIMPQFKSARWIRALEKKACLVSAGSACSTGKQGTSHVLAALGVDADAAGRALRLSSGWETSAEDWEVLLGAILESFRELETDAAEPGSQVISI